MIITDPTLALPWTIIHRVGPVPAVFVFPLAPQRNSVDFPARVRVTPTLNGAYVDDFSGKHSVIANVELTGTFGYDKRIGGIGVPLPGSLHLLAFEKIYEVFNALDRALKQRVVAVQEYINLSRFYFWRIAITRLRYEQRSTEPLLFFYTLQFKRLEDYLSPVGPSLPPGIGGLVSGAGSAIGAGLSGLFG